MREAALDKRLYSAAQFVRQDAVFADIGTDHAYLPIFLLKEGRIRRAFCSDVNEGPLNKAKEHAAASGVDFGIEFCLADGATKLSGKGITDFAICGMGGELIAKIISEAPFLRDVGINLILQPMTKQAYLRRFLSEEGFSVKAEAYSEDGHKYYVCLLASYTGKTRKISDAEAEICAKGAVIVNEDLQIRYLCNKLHAYKKMIKGKKLGGDNVENDEKVARAIEDYLKI